MRNNITFLILIFANLLYGQNSGIFESYIILDTGTGNTYYDLEASTANPDFDNLGTFKSNDILILNGFQNKTHKCETDDILNGHFYYRIYRTSETGGPFSSLFTDIVSFEEDNPLCLLGINKNQTWETNSENIDLLSLITGSGDYYFEVYSTADFTYMSGSGTHFANNGGTNYRASFTVDDPPTVTGSILDSTIEGCDITDLPIAANTVAQLELLGLDITDDITTDEDLVVTSVDAIDNTNPCEIAITRTYTITDEVGNSVDIVHVLTVEDTTAPTFDGTLPTDITVQCGEVPTLVTFTASDNCSTATVIFDEVENLGACAGEYSLVRTWTAIDECNNQTIHTQTITVIDTTDPVLTIPADISIDCSDDTTPAFTGSATATDSCGDVTITFSDAVTNTCGSKVEITRTWTATDDCGNSVSADQIITNNSILIVPVDITLECNDDTSPVSTGSATATDTCSDVTIDFTDVVINTCGNTVVITRTWTASDECGNIVSADQIITTEDTTEPILSIPNDITVECSDDTTPINTGSATATDNCGNVNISFSDDIVAGTCGNTVIITRTWTATDECGNSVSADQIITTVDTTSPVLTIPADISVDCSDDTTPDFTGSATATDTCGDVTISFSDAVTNTCGSKVEITRTWTATDDCGNSVSADQIITNNTVLIIPADITLECNDDTSPITTGSATATDTCGDVVITFADAVASTCGNTVMITRTWTATDECGNSVSADQIITTEDTTNPVLSVPADITIECTDDTTPANTGSATATDTCGDVVITFVDSVANTCGNTVIITRTWTATDECGNSVSADQIITTEDTTNPVLSAPADITVECPDDTSPSNTGSATATDTCGDVTISFTDAVANTCGNTVVITRTWTATDECGNSVSADQIITTEDTTNPILTIPADITVECTDDTTPANTGSATATDTCGDVLITFVDAVANSCGNTVIITRTWTATDECGNSVSADQIITTEDTTNPILSVPADITIECTDDTTPANTGSATATDSCGDVTVSFTDAVANTCGNTVIITRTWTATDACGNFVSADQIITTVNTTNPVLLVPADITVECTDDTTPANTGSATATDTCGDVLITFVDAVANTCGNTVIITRTWTATDACGNSVSSDQIITTVNTTNPVLSVPADITVECTDDTTPANTGSATGTDTCGNVIISFADSVTNTCGNSVVITRTWTATNDCGNSVSADQIITTVDTTAPVVTTAANSLNATLECSNTSGISAALALAPTATDNCDASPSINMVSDITTADATCASAYVRVRTWNFADNCGNTSANFVQTITVQDTTAPVVTTAANSLNATLECSNTSGISAALALAPTATDNCDPSPTINLVSDITTADATCANAYVRVRTWNFTDNCGNTSANFVQTITVQDTTAPVVTTAANSLNATLECSNTSGISAALALAPTATDNCDASLSINLVSDITTTDANCANAYVRVRTWNFTDDCGNTSANFVQTITVQDTTAPVVTTAANSLNATLECSNTSGISAALALAPTATDNCNASPSINLVSDITTTDATCTNAYVRVRTWNFTDDCGNTSANFVQTITIQDTTRPNFVESLPNANITVECSAIPAPMTLTAIDNCGTANVSFTEIRTDGASPFEYTLLRTWIASDACDNTRTHTQTITVRDTTPPITPTLAPISADCSLIVTPPTTTDNCEGTITGTTSSNLNLNSPGTYEIFWIFTDSAGNSTLPVRQEITIIDEAPVPPSTINPLTITGCQISSYNDLIIPTANDFCDGVAIAGSLGDDFIFPFVFEGTQTIIWEFTDSQGNTSFRTQEITLNPLPVDGGSLAGTYEGNDFVNQVDIGSCDGVTVVEMNLTGQSGNIVRWERFAINEGVWVEIANTNATYTVTFAPGALVSTYYRALVQNGTCGQFSSQFFIRALPTGEPPTVENLDGDMLYCLGDDVRIKAISQILTLDENTSSLYENGDFSPGQINSNNPASWLIDGTVGGFSSGGNATKPRNWSGKNCNNQPNGNIVYCGDDNKFAIAYGNYNQTTGPNRYNGPNPTTLESPITDLSNAVTASVDFDQAYNLAVGDLAIIEISFNGASPTGDRIYQPLFILHNPGDPAINWFNAGTAENYLNSTPTFYNFSEDNTSISLQAYLNQDGLDLSQIRIRWSFSGTTNQSAWALDNVNINSTLYQETDIELTDGIGNPIEDPIYVGSTNQEFSITPTAPGTHKYGVTTLINGCRTYDGEGTNLVEVKVSYAYAGENISFIGGDCGQNIVQLNAYDNSLTAIQNASKGAYTLPDNCLECDNPGTEEPGFWTFTGDNVCGDAGFSNPSDPNAKFTAEEGSYTLTWTVAGCSDSIQVVIQNCNQVDFDGVDDYVDFGTNNYNLSNVFSIETWVKLESLSGIQTIFSKRNGDFIGNQFGYDLSVENNGEVSFRFNNENRGNGGKITSAPYKISTNRWYHVAITRNQSGSYVLYIDGIIIKQTAGPTPNSNNFRAILGAMDTGKSTNNNFNGWIDEVRIWNRVLSSEQIRFMMNQEIIPSTTIANNVQGATIPTDVPNLSWNNLIGYYKMDAANIGCGYLNSIVGNNIKGKLKNITSQLVRSAPIPYTSRSDGDWTNINTWTNFNVWDIPNSNGINGAPIDWNIVRTAHDISSGNKNITVLGLLVDNNELSIEDPATPKDETNNGQMLWVTHYLKIDGKIDLVGQSQLLQKGMKGQLIESIYDANSLGILERDRQGTTNPFNYNYWGSPVRTGLNSYSIGGVLRDGTITVDDPINRLINWVPNMTAAGGNPTQVSTRWLYTYFNSVGNTYSQWASLNLNTQLQAGLGFTMKGSGNGYNAATYNGTAKQNYVFVGKPNNGTITNTLGASVNGIPNQILIGNPYPSAIDSDEFIRDNEGVLADGALMFWEHFVGNNTHILRNYQGGYAMYNLTGGVESTTPPITSDLIEIIGGNGTVRPERFIPVGQGFFVNSSLTGGQVQFRNSQRVFKREGAALGNGSVFFRSAGDMENSEEEEEVIKRIRLQFKTPEGALRSLLLGFVPNNHADDNFNYGYDAKNHDSHPSDISWLIDDEKYIIQGVGEFAEISRYPLGIELAISGPIELSLKELENFDTDISVYVFDNLLNTYTLINDSNFTAHMEAGDYFDRFFITFRNDQTLNNSNVENTRNLLYYLFDSKQIYINWSNSYNTEKVELINTLGQSVRTWTQFEVLNTREILIPVGDISEGIYVVKVHGKDGESMSKKVVIKQ